MPRASLQHELRKRRPFDLPEQEAYLSILRTAALLSADFERLFKKHGLSQATFNALRILRGAGHDGRCCREIGEHLVAQVPDVTRLVDRLARAALVERFQLERDRRVVYVRITKKGLDVLAKLDRPLLDLHRAQLHHMGKKDLAALNRLLYLARHPDPRPAES